MKQINEIKHALFLENEYWRNDQLINQFYLWLKGNGITCTIIDRASNRKDEIVAALPKIDAIFFQSTFIYRHEVKGIGDLLKACPKPLMVFGMSSDGTLQNKIEALWSIEELAKMSHHKVFELLHVYPQDGGDWCKEIDMKQYKAEWERLELERIHKNHNMPKTGNKVLIKQLQAFGGQWANLKEGDIVDELDCRSIDKNPHRGIWVMGVGEPVKLLNSDGYEEWEFHVPTYRALTKEFFARGNRANAEYNKEYSALFDLLSEWIRKCSSEFQTSDIELWEWCDNICKTVGVERRGNRRYFERRLKEYRMRYHAFREPV